MWCDVRETIVAVYWHWIGRAIHNRRQLSLVDAARDHISARKKYTCIRVIAN